MGTTLMGRNWLAWVMAALALVTLAGCVARPAGPEDEAAIKRDTGATIRAIPFDQPGVPGRCFYTGQETTQVAIFARAY